MAGRPTKYTPALLDECQVYLDNYQEGGDVMPSHIGLFLHIGISTTCGYDWAKEESKKEFSDILERCMQMQHQKLMNSGLNGEFNSNITKLALGKHGYSDKQDLGINAEGVIFNMNFGSKDAD
jgi:hypothetical protein